MTQLIEPTADERKNGWTARKLAAYRAQREAEIADAGGTTFVPGNVITEFKRPKVRPPVHGADFSYNPHKQR